ncbi:MAG TPA: glycosyltransferase, partial [Isosphaeraceae bacterium]|nr:glycosyltransferase [Isosphaeraceae bacterium]
MESRTLPEVERQSTPALSVVIASVNGWSVLEPTLKALDAQPERSRMEIVVVETVGGETRERLEAHEPPVAIVAMDEKRPIPRLRYLGVTRARGDVVAILEDHGEVAPDWAKQVLHAHQGPWGAVGGSVENGRTGLVNWSAFFCEYTAYMGPVPEGEAADLPGNNIAYKRPHLMRHARVLDDGKWESWINEKLRIDGVPTASTNRMVVKHIKPFKLGYFLVQRFHFSRSYAGMRRVDQSLSKRLIYGFGSLALPGLLMLRVTKNVLTKRRHVGRFLLCSPLVALF